MVKQRGYKSYGELTLNEIVNMYERIAGEWDGDNSGRLEDRANKAKEMLQHANETLNLIIELEEEL